MADNDGYVGVFLSGFIVGGLVGAAVALVLAPQSGHETREQMREKGIEFKERSEEGLKEARARAGQAAAEMRARAEEIAAEAKVRAEGIRQQGVETLEDGVGKIKQAAGTAGDKLQSIAKDESAGADV